MMSPCGGWWLLDVADDKRGNKQERGEDDNPTPIERRLLKIRFA
jgi:hypothetical protein